jgi:hypothetical protein
VPATSTHAGDCYTITTAGTSQSITWSVGDLAIYTGTSGSWVHLPSTTYLSNINVLSTLANSVAPDDFLAIVGTTYGLRRISPLDQAGQLRNALAPRGGITFDGTSATYATAALGNAGNIGESDDFSLNLVFQVPTANPSSSAGIAVIDATSSTPSNNRSLNLTLQSTGVLNISFRNPASPTNQAYDVYLTPNLVSTWGGKRIMLTVVVSASRGTLVLYVNGYSQAFTTSATSFTGYGSNIAGWLTLGSQAGGSASPVSYYAATLYAYALAQADVTEIFELGGHPPRRFRWGYGGNLISNLSRNSTFSALATDWSAGSNATVSAATGNLVVTGTGTGNVYALLAAAYLAAVSKNISGYIRVRGNLSAVGGGAGTIYVNDSGGSQSISIGSSTAAFDTGAVQQAAGTNWGGLTIAPGSGGQVSGATFTLGSVVVTLPGAVCHLSLDDGLGFMVLDQSPNKCHGVLSVSGVAHTIPKQFARIRFTTSTNGNQQILGQQCLPASARIRSWTIDSSGTPTVKLGNTSSGAQFFAAAALVSGLNDITLLTRFCSTNSLWVNSTTTDTLQHTIDYDLVD